MELQGRLDKIKLADLIQMLANGDQEGTLVIKLGDDERKLHVTAEGQVVVRTGPPEHTLLGRRLYAGGTILEQEFLNALRKQSLKARPLAEILRSYKAVSAEKIDQALRLLVTDKLCELFDWEGAEFQFIEGKEEPEGPAREVVFEASALVMEAVRQHDELLRVSTFEWSPSQVYVGSGTPAEPDDEAASCVLSSLDGVRNVEGVAAYCGISQADAVGALWRLASDGAVRLASAAELFKSAEECRHRKQYLKSRWLLKEAARREPSTKIINRLADYSEQDGADEEAVSWYVELGRRLIEDENPVGAVEALRKAVEIDKGCTDAHELLCGVYLNQDNFLGAVKEAEAIEKLCADPAKALLSYKRLMEKKPADLTVRLSVARLLAATGCLEESYEECKKLERVLTGPRQLDLLPVYERIARSGRRNTEITTRIRRIRKLALMARARRKKPLSHRVLSAALAGLFIAYGLYQGGSYVRFRLAKQKAAQLAQIRKYGEASNVLAFVARTARFTPFRNAASAAAEEYLKLAQDSESRVAFEHAFASAQELAAAGKFNQAIKQLEAYVNRFGERAFPEARKKIDDLKQAKANDLYLLAQQLREQALEFEKAGRATKAIEIYERLASDQELSSIAGYAAQRASALRQELEAAGKEAAAARQLESAGKIQQAHAAFSAILAKYPSARNDIPVSLPFLVNSVPPDAEVRFDGKPHGRTPVVVRIPPDGSQRITIAKPGYSPVELEIRKPSEWQMLANLSKLPKWTFRTGGAVDATPALSQGVLFFGSRDTFVYAASAYSGELLWKQRVGPIAEVTSTPAISNSLAIVGAVDGTVAAFDAKSGAPRWRFNTRGYVRSTPEIDETLGRGCVGSADGLIYGFELLTGEIGWKVAAGGAVTVSPARSGRHVFYATEKRGVLAVDIASGEEVWTADIGSAAVGIALADNMVVVGTSGAKLVALAADSGKVEWTALVRGGLKTAPTSFGETIVVGTDLGEIVAFQSATGTELWRFPLQDAEPAHVAAQAGLLVAATTKGKIYAIAPDKGQLLWPAAASAGIGSPPLVTDEGIFVASRDQNVYAYIK